MTANPVALEISLAHDAFRHWLFGYALPFWATTGLDKPGLGFHEQLTLGGEPDDVSYKRIRVQARQIYVYSHAALLGWPQGIEAARRGYEFIVAHADCGNGAWVRATNRYGDILDPTVDLYDLAFILFAFAWYARATGNAEPLTRARCTLKWLRRTMAAPGGGFHNTWPIEPGLRQQNPHMHLLEAVLALYESDPEHEHLVLASELIQLFRSHFVDSATKTLGEFFTSDLRPAEGQAGDHVEPGHHYEWVWLLDQHTRLMGKNAHIEADQLYRFAEAYGVDRTTGAVLDVLGRDGRVRQASSRLWPQAEAIKAHAVMLRRGEPATRRLSTCVNILLTRHFKNCPRGTWREHFDSRGVAIAKKIPTSSMYHIMMAYGELDRLLLEVK